MANNRDRRVGHAFAYLSFKSNFIANRPKAPFSKIRQIYGEELERFNAESVEFNTAKEPLPIHIRRAIKNRIRKQMAEERVKNYLAYGLSGFIIIIFLIVLSYYLPRFL